MSHSIAESQEIADFNPQIKMGRVASSIDFRGFQRFWRRHAFTITVSKGDKTSCKTFKSESSDFLIALLALNYAYHSS